MKKENFKHNHKNRRRAGVVGTKTCFVTKEAAQRTEMLRFVVSPDRVVVFDVAEKLPGRGMWLAADKKLLEQAIAKRIFFKAAHGTVKIPEDLLTQVENALRLNCINLLALCRKAGLLVFGYEAVKKALSEQNVVVAFEAADASVRGQNKLFRADDTFPVYTFFNRAELGQLTGQDEAVHLALSDGKLSAMAEKAACKLAYFMGYLEQKG